MAALPSLARPVVLVAVMLRADGFIGPTIIDKGTLMLTGFEGYLIRFETWEKAVRGSGTAPAMIARLIALARPLRTADGLLDSFKLGLAMGELANHLSDDELEHWQKARRAGGDLNVVPYVRTPLGPVS